jgi:hypothetical protein
MTSAAGAKQDALGVIPAPPVGRREPMQPLQRATTLLHTWFDGFTGGFGLLGA